MLLKRKFSYLSGVSSFILDYWCHWSGRQTNTRGTYFPPEIIQSTFMRRWSKYKSKIGKRQMLEAIGSLVGRRVIEWNWWNIEKSGQNVLVIHYQILCEIHHQRTRAKKIIFDRYFFSVFFVNKNRNIKNHDLPATARLNKAKLTKIDNEVRISYRNYFPLSFSSLVVELDVG